MKTKIPQRLQPILWSRDVKSLDLEKDRAYIINQTLACGTFKHLNSLFKAYSEEEIKKVFLKKPMKIYSPLSFNWIKTILLENLKQTPDENKYVENLPRNI